MNYLIAIIFITVSITNEAAKVYFQKYDKQKQCYFKDVLVIVNHSPNQLAVNRRTNTLFFSSDVGGGDYVPVMLDINTKKVKVLQGIKDAYAMSNNDDADEIYFGGSHGIHKYQLIDKTSLSLAITNLDIWWLHYRNDIYFVQFPQLNAYVFRGRTIRMVKQLRNTIVHQFVFDKDGYTFFLNTSGLYGVQKLTNKHVLVRSRVPFYGLAVDNGGEVYVCSDSGIFMVSKVGKVQRIVRVTGAMAIAFDKDNNLIYSNSQELVRLVPVDVGAFNSTKNDKTFFCN